MILVDTDVWSLAFRRQLHVLTPGQTAARHHLEAAIATEDARLIGAIRQQVLTGMRVRAKFESIREDLAGVPELPVRSSTPVLPAECANRCIDRGVATDHVDMLICAVSIETGVPIWTVDTDFGRYGTAFPLPPLYVLPIGDSG